MEIFYLRKSEFLKFVDRESLEKFSDGREYASEEKYLEHLCGLFLTKFIAKHFYEIEDVEIEIKHNKPFFKSRELFFSVSHSKDIVLVAFNNKNIGVDIEYMSEDKNFKAIMERYGEKIKNPTSLDFYRFWTLHEAEIKLDAEIKSLFSSRLENDYMVSCVSDDALVGTFCIRKLVCNEDRIDLVEEFKNPKSCKLVLSVE